MFLFHTKYFAEGAAVSEAKQAIFEPRGGESWRDPFGMYRALRDHDPVHHVADNGEGEDYWVLSRFGHIFDAAVDAATFSSASGLTFLYDEMGKLGLESPIVMMDPPEHTSLRKLATKKLTPRQVKDIEPEIRALVVERVNYLREMGEGDIVEELLRPLASFVVAHFLGVPLEDRGRFNRWTDAIVSAAAEGDVLHAGEAVGEMVGYFSQLIEKRRADPTDDMISALLHQRMRDGEEVSLAKILGVGFTMVTGGNDTIMGLLGGALELMTQHPDQRGLLLEEPANMQTAIEEFLRLTSPVQGLARTTTREVELEGKIIPMGRKVMLLYGSANLDEREFGPTAPACDVTRRIRRHLSFSYGPHHCIGAAAARLQSSIALEEILGRCPQFSVDAKAGRYAAGPFVRRYEYLPFFANGAV